jgi:Tubulin-tyrosine ligase family
VHEQVFHAAKDKLFRREGYFDLLGFDFMLDDKLELYLLEVNTNPALSLDSSSVLQEVCTLAPLVPYIIATVQSMLSSFHAVHTQWLYELLCILQVAICVSLAVVHSRRLQPLLHSTILC